MLWSIIKILIFVAIVGVVALGAGWLMEYDGAGLRLTFNGNEITLSALQMVIALVLMVITVWLLLKGASFLVALLRFINGDETALSRYFDRNRERKGFQALSEGLMALASGEGRTAMTKAQKAGKLLDRPELTDLVTAQAAEMTGDRKKAEEAYKRLIKRDETKFVGVRGILRQKLADGDTDTALKLAEKAFTLRPKHEETQDTLLKLQTRTEDWTGARKTLNAKLKAGNMPRDLHKRREAVLGLSKAQAVIGENSTIEMREAAIEANRLSPDLIPAAVLAARSYIEQGKKRNALRIVKKAWEAHPHPDLARAFAEIEPGETPEARLKRFQQILRLKPEHRETKLLNAELHIAAEDFPGARRALGDLPDSDPDARVLTLMAAIERGEGSDDAIVRGWLARALTAKRGPQWVCENCHNIQAEWSPVCKNCESFDTLSWTIPPEGEVSLPAGAEMLPLIVGTIEDKRKTPDAAPTEDTAPTDAEVLDAETVDAPEPDEETGKPAETTEK